VFVVPHGRIVIGKWPAEIGVQCSGHAKWPAEVCTSAGHSALISANYQVTSDRASSFFCIAANRVVDFLTVNRHIAWGIYSNANLITPHFNDRDANIVTNNDRFVALP